jgi:glucose/arabinose dehydrogenase
VILKVAPDGTESSQQILSHESEDINESLGNYFAYGIRNSFGIDFDPVTGNLWDTENGPSDYDEINLVLPGFNSGWQQVMGPIERSGMSESDLLAFNGSHYRDPAFSWHRAQGVTDIEFLNSTALGSEYVNNIFVGDINNGNLYYFKVNEERDGLSFDASGLEDLVADNNDEVDSVTFGTGFEGITDLETGPDGYLYILTFGGNLYRIVPNS